jgi:aspartyl aminopeptidase
VTDPILDLLAFIDRSPTPYHAVTETLRRLQAAGFRRVSETEAWPLAPGNRICVTRGDATLAAFVVGEAPPDSAEFRVLGAHTDSPNLRVKPRPDANGEGCRLVTLEPYGGVLLYTWLDRDLSLAGRVSILRGGALDMVTVDFERPVLRIPSLAIHLQREIREEGLKLNPQMHLSGVFGTGDGSSFSELLAREVARVSGSATHPDEIIAFDLMAYDTASAAVGGVDNDLICASRLDNLASCHAALSALLRTLDKPAASTSVVVLYDHEEVGSRSARGAAGTFLRDLLIRLGEAWGGTEAAHRSIARSAMISVDMAHAVHPNWMDRHERGHRPVLGGGPVLKVNVNQSYATDAATAGFFLATCRECDVRAQHFVARSDMACGSTIGPISSAAAGIPAVDVGNPMLSMHACRETAAGADVEPMIRVLTRFLER